MRGRKGKETDKSQGKEGTGRGGKYRKGKGKAKEGIGGRTKEIMQNKKKRKSRPREYENEGTKKGDT